MNRLRLLIAAAAVAAAALAPSLALAQPAVTPSPSPAPPPRAVEPAPAPAFKAGDVVVDRTGTLIGAIKTLTESDRGPMVVVEIDGKLVSVPSNTLKLQGGQAMSSQTKAQMLAAANAPG